ncbi:MAG: GNAT family N-acetyltransferase [Clostridia bacterium]|nr:GNAT family N-acetyltransferase [Clostridia bacterium]
MELKKFIAPFDAEEPLKYLEQIFGIEERLLEECQLNGSETDFNTDIVYLAYEDNTLLGMIHATIPKATPHIAGLSAMFTTPAARGKGLGNILFKAIVDEVSSHNVRLTVLGTCNPIAAKLYAKYGFAFCPGSNVMARFSSGNMVDFTNDYYTVPKGKITVSHGNQAMRIPIVPLVLQTNLPLILDINTKIFNSNTITQRSCMGLFPRYEELRKHGGDYFMAFDDSGTLGAAASVCRMDDGTFRGDFFSLPSFEYAIPEMLQKMEDDFSNVYFEIAKNDTVKKKHLEENGFKPIGDSYCKTDEFTINTVKYAR